MPIERSSGACGEEAAKIDGVLAGESPLDGRDAGRGESAVVSRSIVDDGARGR